jgi:bacteriorhodopsin
MISNNKMEIDQVNQNCPDNILDLCEITNFTYLFAFLVLTFSIIITGIEAFKTTNLKYRIVLTIETFVSLVAGYVYYKYLSNAESTNGIACCDISEPRALSYLKNRLCNNEQMRTTGYRYLDWFITTPFLLLALCLLINTNNDFPWGQFGIIVLLNEIMLVSGYLAETDRINKLLGWIVGTVALIIMFIIIYFTFNPLNQPIFWFFVVLWSLYGIVFFLPYNFKTICYNILDVIAKAGFGIWTWLIAVELISP